MQSDDSLVEAVLAGERQAFEKLVLRYEKLVRAACLDILRDYHLASDAAQDAFVSAYQKLGTLRDRNTFGSWVVQIAKRRSLDIVRRKRIEVPIIDDGYASKSDDGEFLLDDEKRQLLAAVMRLDDGEREAIMLRYFDGRSVRDVSDIMGKGVGTITKQLCRAHAKLKSILERSQSEVQK